MYEWGLTLCTCRLNWGHENVVTLPSKHRFRNSSPGGLRPSTLSLHISYYFQNTKNWSIVAGMLGRRRRRWAIILSTLGQCFLFTWIHIRTVYSKLNEKSYRLLPRLQHHTSYFKMVAFSKLTLLQCLGVHIKATKTCFNYSGVLYIR